LFGRVAAVIQKTLRRMLPHRYETVKVLKEVLLRLYKV
jgi:hypothetical protein